MALEALNATQDFRSGMINWYRRNESGVLVVRQQIGEFISFHKTDPRNVQNRKFIKYAYKDGDYYRVSWRDRFVREQYCKGIPDIYEADVSSIRRILSDAESVVIQKPKRLYFDLETDSRVPFQQARIGGARILCWAAATDEGQVFSGLLEDEADEDENRILADFWKIAEGYDQLLAWNGDAFDFEIIKERTRALGAYDKNVRKWLYLDHMITFKKNNLNSAESADEKISLKLNDVAQAIVGQGKHDLDGRRVYEEWKRDPKKLLAYNEQDARLMPMIEAKTGYIDAFHEVCNICRVFPESSSLKPTRFVDGFLLALGAKLGHRFASKFYGGEPEKESVVGAFCKEPAKLGIHRNIAVADFKSLYPSIIRTFNMSPENKGEGSKCPTTGVSFRNDREGILCIALSDMGKNRKFWSDKKDAAEPESEEWKHAGRLSMAIKVISNSFYGVILNEFSRFYDKEIGESITTTGQFLIKKTMEAAEQEGMEVQYGDTDSIFVNYKNVDFEKFVQNCNKNLYPSLLKEMGCTRNFLSLEFEKEFAWIAFSSDGEGNPVKKRYIGQFATFGGKKVINPKPKLMGLEFKRSDSIRLARELQKTVLDMLCSGIHHSMPYEKLVTEFRERVLRGYLSVDDVVQSKSISRDLDAYKNQSAAHVRIAREIEEEGGDCQEGTRIYYYVADGSTSPTTVKVAEEFANDADRHYVWSHLTYPATMRLLGGCFPLVNWRRWLKTSKDRVLPGQLGLFGG